MHKTLVLGASLKTNRYSNMAVHRLRAHNITTEAFGLKKGNIGDTQIKTNFNDFQNIHTVTLYVGAGRQPDYYGEILKLKPQRVIFNPGTENPEFYKILKDNAIEVEVACTLVLLATNQYSAN
ncbi:CoA-binding protein [Aggregatimonas sangjinii]|uniref:CoA-binding protein n=1 Tax=Aggregatimonas sangjinii TaxID=2583587 RepID=A0A5B7SPE9_9FLAO|nr:CoA-binding protein [Aggregatimonas sangjinii]QCW99268.1 CoA-binding protein [Aggregatimonas sangjinii]